MLEAPAAPEAAVGYDSRVADVPDEFAVAMDEDLSIPRALSVVFLTVRDGSKLVAAAKVGGLGDADRAQLVQLLAQVELMLDILGVNPTDPAWAGQADGASATEGSGDDDPVRAVLDSLVDLVAHQRLDAKAAKDFATADALRDRLREAGVLIEDTPDGYRYDLARD